MSISSEEGDCGIDLGVVALDGYRFPSAGAGKGRTRYTYLPLPLHTA